MRLFHNLIGAARRLRMTPHGAVSVEFALATTFFLLPLVVGAIDLGKGLWVRMQVGNSARAGAEFATACACADTLKIGNAVTQTITDAEQGAAGLGTAITAHSAYFCGCKSTTPLTITFADGTATTLDGLNLAPGVTINSSRYAIDPTSSTQLNSCVPASSANYCSDGTKPGTYVAVTAGATYTPFLNYPWIVPASGSFQIQGDATARIQ